MPKIASFFFLLVMVIQLKAQLVITPQGGSYAAPVAVTIEAKAEARIYFTVDGSKPTAKSPQWLAGETRLMDRSMVLRAIALNAEGKTSLPVGATYLIGEPATKLPIVSVGIDPWRLFDRQNGWFEAGPQADRSNWKMPGAKWWTEAEHPGHLELIEPDGTLMFSGQVGYRMFGGMSRLHPQKSLSVSCRKKYGASSIEYPIFGPDEQDQFKFLVFRNGGSDWSRSHFRDALLSSLIADPSWDLDHQANRPALLYINGKYWGIYHIREKINKAFVADHRGYDKDALDLLEHEGTVKSGSGRAYDKLLLYLKENGFYEVSAYHRLREMMDVDNFMRFQIAQAYFDNRDAGGNIRFFRPHLPDEMGVQKWRWILYDLDYSFGLHDPNSYAYNTLAVNAQVDGPPWPNPPWSTFIQRKLLANEEYRRFFVNRALDYLQTDFSAATVLQVIDAKVATLEPEMPRALQRWELPLDNWYFHVDRLREFARLRPVYFREHLREFFGGGDDREVQLSVGHGGSIVLNDNVAIAEKNWQGRYFANVPLRLRAKPAPGYRFVGWASEHLENTQKLEQDVALKKKQPYKFSAQFAPIVHAMAEEITVTEIAGSATAGGAWIELYNRSLEKVTLQDWLLTNRNGKEIRLPLIELLPETYAVLSAEKGRFEEAFPGTMDVYYVPQLKKMLNVGNIGLYSNAGAIVDEADFLHAPDRVFAVTTASSENDAAVNWMDVTAEPTPGGPNAISPLQMSLHKGDIWWRLLGAVIILLVLLTALKRKATNNG